MINEAAVAKASVAATDVDETCAGAYFLLLVKSADAKATATKPMSVLLLLA